MIYWIAACISLLGVWLNIKKKVICFYLWAFSSAVWIYVDFKQGIYAQGALQVVLFWLAVYGAYSWRKKREK